MPAKPKIQFITQENKYKHLSQVLYWLKSDFDAKGMPGGHFWHNYSSIAEAFNNLHAMVVLNDENEAIAYVTWSIRSAIATIDYLEVKVDYRRHGIGKDMLTAFAEEFPSIAVLSANVLPTGEPFFRQLGWQDVGGKSSKFKFLRPGVIPTDILPTGCVIAICLEDYYTVVKNPEKYHKKYFQVTVEEEGKLSIPILAQFHPESYMAIYYNQKLIAQGKARHIFSNDMDMIDYTAHVLAMSQIIPHNLSIFHGTGFSVVSELASKKTGDEPSSDATHKSHTVALESSATSAISTPTVLNWAAIMVLTPYAEGRLLEPRVDDISPANLLLKRIHTSNGMRAGDVLNIIVKKDRVEPFCWKTRAQFLKDYGLEIADYGAGANCLFRLMAVQIGADAELGLVGNADIDHETVRKLAVAAILSQRAAFGDLLNAEYLTTNYGKTQASNFDRYVELMNQLGMWGGQIELFVLARLLARPIIVVSDNMRPQIFEKQAIGEPLFFYRIGNHYQAVIARRETARTTFERVLRDIEALQVAPAATVHGAHPFFSRSAVRRRQAQMDEIFFEHSAPALK